MDNLKPQQGKRGENAKQSWVLWLSFHFTNPTIFCCMYLKWKNILFLLLLTLTENCKQVSELEHGTEIQMQTLPKCKCTYFMRLSMQ